MTRNWDTAGARVLFAPKKLLKPGLLGVIFVLELLEMLSEQQTNFQIDASYYKQISVDQKPCAEQIWHNVIDKSLMISIVL